MLISKCHNEMIFVESCETGAHYVCGACGRACETKFVEPIEVVDLTDA